MAEHEKSNASSARLGRTWSIPTRESTTHIPLVSDYWSWIDNRACKNEILNTFFPTGKNKAVKEQQAKKICMSCPVINNCREHALTTPEEFGVWGGLTEKERKEIRKKKNH